MSYLDRTSFVPNHAICLACVLQYTLFILFSSIWAPQPHAYNIGSTPNHSSKVGDSSNEPISEGDEADEEFLPAKKAPLLTKIREIRETNI